MIKNEKRNRNGKIEEEGGGRGDGVSSVPQRVTHQPAVALAHLHKTDNARSKTRKFDLAAPCIARCLCAESVIVKQRVIKRL